MRIAERVALLGSGDLGGASLSHELDCNVYLVVGEPEHLLIDSGVGLESGRLVDHISALGLDPNQVKHLFLTHKHGDHAGGAAELRSRLDMRVYASQECAAAINSGDDALTSVDVGKRAGAYPTSYTFEPCPVDVTLADGDSVEIGGVSVLALATPGHSADHLCYLIKRGASTDLFAGDAVLPGGTVSLQDTYDCSVLQMGTTIEKLSALEFQGFFPGHGLFSVRRGKRHVLAALGHVKSGGLPASFNF